MANKRKVGRPTKYTIELGEHICELIAGTTQSLTVLCSENDTLPHRATLIRWIGKHPEFRDLYARAREAQADVLAEEIISIADETSNDTLTIQTRNGEIEAPNNEWINRSRLRVDARKWLASKLAPKKYGDKLDVTSDNEKITSINVTVKRATDSDTN